MRKLSQREIVLSVLMLAGAIVLYVQYVRGAFSTQSPAEAARAAVQNVAAADPNNVVDVSLSMERVSQIRPHSRNLFNYADSPEKIADMERQRREQARLAAENAVRQREAQEAAARAAAENARQLAISPPPPPPPDINFRFIGKMGEPKAPIAILVDVPTGEIYTASEGEALGDQFVVKKIDFDSVTIAIAPSQIAKDPVKRAGWTEASKTIRMGGS